MLTDQAYRDHALPAENERDECIGAYLLLSDRIFQMKRHRITTKGSIQGRFDSEELERAVKGC